MARTATTIVIAVASEAIKRVGLFGRRRPSASARCSEGQREREEREEREEMEGDGLG
jgi:hypothetical protein